MAGVAPAACMRARAGKETSKRTWRAWRILAAITAGENPNRSKLTMAALFSGVARAWRRAAAGASKIIASTGAKSRRRHGPGKCILNSSMYNRRFRAVLPIPCSWGGCGGDRPLRHGAKAAETPYAAKLPPAGASAPCSVNA